VTKCRMGSPAEDFNTLVSGVDYPMFIVTAVADGRRAGCLVGFVTQASIDPPRLLVMLSKTNHTYEIAQRTETLAVHFLHEANRELASLFGERTGDHIDKFQACEWTDGPEGTPLLRHTRGWVLGRVLARLDSGDHVAHLLETIDATSTHASGQLSFQTVRDMVPGNPA
jgi:flavin reductase (DIM6/NTAB) family NADH-FMN oxidoreductase RutF